MMISSYVKGNLEQNEQNDVESFHLIHCMLNTIALLRDHYTL